MSNFMDARTDHVLWFDDHSVWQTVDSGADISDRACISLLSKQDNRPYTLWLVLDIDAHIDCNQYTCLSSRGNAWSCAGCRR